MNREDAAAFSVAPMGRRMGAYVIDLIICLIVLTGWRVAVAPDEAVAPPLGFWIGLFAFIYAYSAVSTYLGASPGKRLLHLRVVDAERGCSPTAAASAIRAAIWLTGVFSAVWALADPRNRALHDRVASTLVIAKRG